MRLLLISNSTNAGEAYLDYPKYQIRDFLGAQSLKCIFIPYAGVTISFDEYENRVKERFSEVGHSITSIHHFENPVKAIEEAEAIVVGGMGARPMQGFAGVGIHVYFADKTSVTTVGEAVAKFAAGQLPEMNADQVCKGSGNCHH